MACLGFKFGERIVVLNLVNDIDFNDPLNTQTLSVKYTHQFDIL